MCCLHEVYNEKGSFLGYLLTIQNACPTVKAFHRMNLNQNKCTNFRVAGKNLGRLGNRKHTYFFLPNDNDVNEVPSKAPVTHSRFLPR